MDIKDRIRGSMIGGAVGDALGYPIEFSSLGAITATFGEKGIQSFMLDEGAARFSDDTQMTLFTANGLLAALAAGDKSRVNHFIYLAYLDWLITQGREVRHEKISWLLNLIDLYRNRAPGMTCLSALKSGEMGTVTEPLNYSKGCGGIMRVAPIGLCAMMDSAEEAFIAGCDAAAITHGHPHGWMPAGALAYIIYKIVFDASDLRPAVENCTEFIRSRYEGEYAFELADMMEEAINAAAEITDNIGPASESGVDRFGEGWTGESALYISLYSAARFEHDFDSAVICAVNHSGDSDSTGAITGNIVGAINGYKAVSEKWLKDLEMRDVILEISDDIAACADGKIPCDDRWNEKYRDGFHPS